MSKEQAVIEIRNSSINVVVGYLNEPEDKVNVLYASSFKLDEDIVGAYISKKEDVIKVLQRIVNIKASNNLNINISKATLVYPSFGLNVYSSTKQTNTVDPNSTICQIDIDNVISLIKKEKLLNPNDALVEILPIRFFIDGGRPYAVPPINEVSSSIQLSANVYVLPKNLVATYQDYLNFAGIKCEKKVISPVALSFYLEKKKYKYQTYALIDFNTRITTVSLIGNNKVYSSSYFEYGLNHLVDTIIDQFKITEEQARKLLSLYGLDLRSTEYDPYIIETYINGINVKIKKEQLNTIIIQFLNKWVELLNNCVSTLINNGYIGQYVIYGESLNVKGFKDKIKQLINVNVDYLESNVIGCEDSSFMNCIASLYYSSFYKGSSADISTQKRVNKVTRDGEYSEIKDEL